MVIPLLANEDLTPMLGRCVRVFIGSIYLYVAID